MGEYDRVQKKQVSRAVANSEAGSRHLNKNINGINIDSPVQMLTVRPTGLNEDIRALAEARRIEHPSLGVSGHNYAVGKGYPDSWAVSNHAGHSEARCAAKTLGILANRQNIEILSERKPCGSCQSDMEGIENATAHNVNVTVSYLVDIIGDAAGSLRGLYSGL